MATEEGKMLTAEEYQRMIEEMNTFEAADQNASR